jgi:hemerythrin-like domain-containing protein
MPMPSRGIQYGLARREDEEGGTMQSLDSYRSSHAELRQMIDDLQSILTPEHIKIRPNAKTAYELLCDLGDKVKHHLAEEDRSIYPSLLIHDDPKVKSIAWGFISGEKPLRKVFDDYYKKWLKNCDFNFSGDFLAETNEVFHMLAHRIDREEQVLFPKLVEIGLFQEVRAG